MALRLRLDHAGIEAMLKSDEVAHAVAEMAEDVALFASADEAVIRHAIPVDTDEYETDRAAASVTLAHPVGLAIEAKYGPLVRAASDAGLEVRSRA